MNSYGIGFDEKQELQLSSYYHPNYNLRFPKDNGGVPHWMCVQCAVGLKVIEYCLQCPKCGLIVIKNLYSGWNGRNYPQQSSSYKYELHYKTWMDCILAREEITPSLEKVIKDVKNKLNANSEVEGALPLNDVKSVRNVLKKIGHNKHYKHAPLILKRVSGIGPPDIPDNKLEECRSIFSDVMRAYIHCFSSSNAASYPYIIYKIFDKILDEPFTRRVLDYIYLQSQKTIAKRDKEWEVISDLLLNYI